MKKDPIEIQFQKTVMEVLSSDFNLIPFSVTYSVINSPLLAISFYDNDDLNELLDLLNYKNMCDKSGLILISERNTVILTGNKLALFFKFLQSE